MQDTSACLRTMYKMNEPFLEPYSVNSASSNFSLGGSVIRSAEGAETVLRFGSDVWVAGVDGEFQTSQHKEGSEVRLIQHVQVRVSRKTATIMQVALNLIDLIGESGADAILNLQEPRGVGHVVNARQVCCHQLAHWLRAKGCWSNHELGYVWPYCVTPERTSEQ